MNSVQRIPPPKYSSKRTEQFVYGVNVIQPRSKPTTISLSYSTPHKLVFFCILCWKVLQMCSGLCEIPTSWEMNVNPPFSHTASSSCIYFSCFHTRRIRPISRLKCSHVVCGDAFWSAWTSLCANKLNCEGKAVYKLIS